MTTERVDIEQMERLRDLLSKTTARPWVFYPAGQRRRTCATEQEGK